MATYSGKFFDSPDYGYPEYDKSENAQLHNGRLYLKVQNYVKNHILTNQARNNLNNLMATIAVEDDNAYMSRTVHPFKRSYIDWELQHNSGRRKTVLDHMKMAFKRLTKC